MHFCKADEGHDASSVMAFARACQLLAVVPLEHITDVDAVAAFVRGTHSALDALPGQADSLTLLVFKQIATSVVCNLFQLLCPQPSNSLLARDLVRLGAVNSVAGLRSQMKALLSDATRNLEARTSTVRNAQVVAALGYLRVHFNEHSLTLSAVARNVGLSKWRLAHLLREHTTMTFCEHVRCLRVNDAKRLLNQACLSVKEIAYY